jgi:Protein of unknwon function (DUF3310)
MTTHTAPREGIAAARLCLSTGNACAHYCATHHDCAHLPAELAQTTTATGSATTWQQRATVTAPADARQIGGSHYKTKAIQPWAAMQAWMTPEAFEGFLRGNVIKYVARCEDKGGVEDLKKAAHYLAKLIETKTTKATNATQTGAGERGHDQ